MTTPTIAPAARPRPSRGLRGARRRADDPVLLLTVPLRQLRLEVLLWAFRLGQPVDADALTCILLAKQDRADDPSTLWTAEAVRRLLWVDIVAQCVALERPPPAGAGATIWTLLDFLDATHGFADGSDNLTLLREPLIDSGGVGRRRRTTAAQRRHPAAR